MAAHTGPQQPSLLQALIPVLVLVALLALNVVVFGDSGLDGPNQLALLFAAAIAICIGLYNKHAFIQLLDHIIRGITTALTAVLILLLIGALAATWLISGIVPAMIDHGLLLLTPKAFLVAACLVCCVISLATGSSWSTAATVGIALMGIGKALGFHEGMVAGAVISGAYFGDKLSPLSDTTNLAPAVAGTDLFAHIRYMLNTTVPSISIALLAFLAIGLFWAPEGGIGGVEELRAAIHARFSIGWWLYLVPLAVVVMIWKRIPALPALFIGMLLGALAAVIFQRPLLNQLAGGDSWQHLYKVIMSTMGSGVSIETGNATVDELLTAKGMYGMLKTIWLILSAMVFGGAMEGAGMLQRMAAAILTKARTDGSLIAATAGSCVLVNATASDQYLSIVVPGRMFAPVYAERGLHPKVLSRTLEDSGTVTSALVPWNTCGAYMGSVLGVATMTYLPFCFFNLISPVMTVLQGAFGWRIARIPKA
ncbi:MAG: Na+/H+ antiporter NhaC [Flavobacteriales bacterium]